MTCVTKEYKIKTKMEQERLQLKMTFLLGYNLKFLLSGEGRLTFGGERIKIWWGRGTFPVRRGGGE